MAAALLAAALPLAAAASRTESATTRASPAPAVRPIAVTLSGAIFDDSSGVSSQNPRVVFTFTLPRDAELRIGGGLSRLSRAPFTGEDGTLGASVAVPWRSLRGTVAYALHALDGGSRHEAALGVRADPFPSFRAGIALHQRPFVDVVPALAVDEQLFHDAGPGGASDPHVVSGIDVRELRLSLGGSPLRGAYAFAEGRAQWIDDGNRASTLSAGAGVSLLRALGVRLPVDLSVRWELYAATYAHVAPAYYSPARVVTHGPGAEVRGKVAAALELAAEGGLTYASDGSEGWYAGVLAGVRLGRVTAGARAQLRDDPWYQSRRLWLAIERAF